MSPSGILSRCQLPRPNCQRTKQADRNKTPPPRMEATSSRPAHDLLRQSLPWTEVRRGLGSQYGQRIRNGPQPMISFLNPITTTAASDCLAGESLTYNRTRQRQGSGDHEPFGGNRSNAQFKNWFCQIGRTTGGRLGDFLASVKRPSGFLLFRCFHAELRRSRPPPTPLSGTTPRRHVDRRGGPGGPSLGSFLIERGFWIGFPSPIPAQSVQCLRPW